MLPDSVDSTLECEAFKLRLPLGLLCQVIYLVLTFAHFKTYRRTAYDWKSLPDDALVVDVGGGIGATSIPLSKAFSQLKIVVQDRKPVVETGIEVRNLSTRGNIYLPCCRCGKRNCRTLWHLVVFSSKVSDRRNRVDYRLMRKLSARFPHSSAAQGRRYFFHAPCAAQLVRQIL